MCKGQALQSDSTVDSNETSLSGESFNLKLYIDDLRIDLGNCRFVCVAHMDSVALSIRLCQGRSL